MHEFFKKINIFLENLNQLLHCVVVVLLDLVYITQETLLYICFFVYVFYTHYNVLISQIVTREFAAYIFFLSILVLLLVCVAGLSKSDYQDEKLNILEKGIIMFTYIIGGFFCIFSVLCLLHIECVYFIVKIIGIAFISTPIVVHLINNLYLVWIALSIYVFLFVGGLVFIAVCVGLANLLKVLTEMYSHMLEQTTRKSIVYMHNLFSAIFFIIGLLIVWYINFAIITEGFKLFTLFSLLVVTSLLSFVGALFVWIAAHMHCILLFKLLFFLIFVMYLRSKYIIFYIIILFFVLKVLFLNVLLNSVVFFFSSFFFLHISSYMKLVMMPHAANEMMYYLIRLYADVVCIGVSILFGICTLLMYIYITNKNIASRNIYSIRNYQISSGTEALIDVLLFVLPTFIICYILTPTLIHLYRYDLDSQTIASVFTIEIIGNQWYWTYKYNFPRMLYCKDIELLYDITDIVIEIESRMSEDTVERLHSVDNVLVIPKDTAISVEVTSTDVIHSFGVPQLGIKIDAIPGRYQHSILYAEFEGTYYGHCYELCGTYHGFMPIVIKVVSIEEFVLWSFQMLHLNMAALLLEALFGV